MAKELPYYKFEPSEWLEGEIQVCSDIAIVCFINLCSGYWLKLGSISYAFALHKYMRKDANVLQELINCNIISVQEDKICINFLDKQLKEFKKVSNKRSEAANKRWKKRSDNQLVNANALQLESTSNAIREEKRREEERKEESILIRETEFKNSLKQFLEFYPKDLLNNFYLYWTEKKPKGRKMRFEMEKTFDVKRRLERWNKNNFNNNNNLKAENNEQLKTITDQIRLNNPSL